MNKSMLTLVGAAAMAAGAHAQIAIASSGGFGDTGNAVMYQASQPSISSFQGPSLNGSLTSPNAKRLWAGSSGLSAPSNWNSTGGLAVDPVNRKLYSVSGSTRLGVYDLNNIGGATEVKPTLLTTTALSNSISALAWADSKLYAYVNLGGAGSLYTLNPTTFAMSKVYDFTNTMFGMTTAGIGLNDLANDEEGNLYAVLSNSSATAANGIFRIDKNAANATKITSMPRYNLLGSNALVGSGTQGGNTGTTRGGSAQGLAIKGKASDNSLEFYMIAGGPDTGAKGAYGYKYTGTSWSLFDTPNYYQASAGGNYIPSGMRAVYIPAAAVPEPGTMMALGVGLLAVVRRRRK